jgi:hypothetical protein
MPFGQLFPDKERGKTGANNDLEQFGELKDARVEVELSD